MRVVCFEASASLNSKMAAVFQWLLAVTNYRLDVMIWNKNVQEGYLTVKLHSNGKEAVATIDQ